MERDKSIKTVLFVCFHNAGRSQMAEAFLNKLAGERGLPVRARSAGTLPKYREVNPVVVEAMKEVQISLEAHSPKMITAWDIEGADRVITMHCGVEPMHCPTGLPDTCVDWDLPDPAEQPLERVRQIRDQVKERVEGLLAELAAEIEKDGNR